ncbi:MAG: tyrosine-type recombinase/integrase [Anaerolineales bacterium]
MNAKKIVPESSPNSKQVDDVDAVAMEWVVVPDLEEEFTASLRRKDRSERTVRAYAGAVADFRTWFEAHNPGQPCDPAHITPLDVRSYRTHLRDERRLSVNTVNSYLAGLRAFCKWAQGAGHAQHDPTSGIKSLKVQRSAPKWLEASDQYALLRAAEQAVQLGDLRAGGEADAPGAIWSRRDRALVVFMLNSGLRLSEVAALTLDDITIRPRSGWVDVRAGKGSKARRVELNKDARKALSEWLAVRPEEEGCAALWISQKGGALSKRALSGRITVLGEAAGLDIHPHTLRHSFAKNLVRAGVGLEVVADLLGHENLDTTRIYTTPSAADRQAAVEKVRWAD